MAGSSGEPTGDGEKPSEAETGEWPDEWPDERPSAEPGRGARVLGRIRAWVPAGWWLPVGFGAVLALVVLAAFPPWPAGVAEGLSVGPWWVVLPALAAAASLVFGIGSRVSAWWAAGAAGVAVGAGLYAFFRSPDGSDGSGGSEMSLAESLAQSPARPVAPLAAALACAVAGLLCVALARRARAWPRPEGRVQARRLVVLGVVGALVGGLLSAAAGFGAGKVQQALEGSSSQIDAVSSPVPAKDRSALSQQVKYERLSRELRDVTPGKVSWERTLSSPVGLSECLLDDRPDERTSKEDDEVKVAAQSMLVSVKNGRKSDAVIGHDPRDGGEIWRYTVNHAEAPSEVQRKGLRDGESRLGQVGVAPDCRVLVMVDPFTLVSLNASTGEVEETTTLPVTPSSAGGKSDGWRFVTADLPAEGEVENPGRFEAPTYEREPLVQLASTPRVFLETADAAVEVNGTSGKLTSFSPAPEAGCKMLVDNPVRTSVTRPRALQMLIQDCRDATAFTLDVPASDLSMHSERQAAQDEDLEGVFPLVPYMSPQIPFLGCEKSPRIYDLHTGYEGTDTALVFGEWCKDRERDQDEKPDGEGSGNGAGDGEGPVMVEMGMHGKTYDAELKPYKVFQLPKDTELPLRPKSTRTETAWLSGGELHTFSSVVSRHEVTPRSKAMAEEGPLEAFVPPEFMKEQHRSLSYAVTTSGRVLKLAIADSLSDSSNVDQLDPVAAFDGAEGKCAGTRDLRLDQINQQLLMTCSTDAGTKVTALTDAKK